MTKRQYPAGLPGMLSVQGQQMGYPQQLMGGYPHTGYPQTGYPHMGGYPPYGHGYYHHHHHHHAGYSYGMTGYPHTGYPQTMHPTTGMRKEKE